MDNGLHLWICHPPSIPPATQKLQDSAWMDRFYIFFSPPAGTIIGFPPIRLQENKVLCIRENSKDRMILRPVTGTLHFLMTPHVFLHRSEVVATEAMTFIFRSSLMEDGHLRQTLARSLIHFTMSGFPS